MIEDIVGLLTPSTVLGSVLLGIAFGAFAAQFDAVPEHTALLLTALVVLFVTVGIVGLVIMRFLDADYPGEYPWRPLSTLASLLIMAAGSYVGDRLARWLEHRQT